MDRQSPITELVVRIPWLGPRVAYRLQRRGIVDPPVSWPRLVAMVEAERPGTVSIDIFDTALIRDLANDEVVEQVVERAGSADRAERELCRAVPGLADHLARIRATGARLVFLSDTDRSSRLLRELLAANGLFRPGDDIIASCEVGATKSRGDLFTRMWPGRRRRSVWHVGNNTWADATMALAAGVVPRPVVEADLNRYEQVMASSADGYGPALAGAARRYRLDVVATRRAGRIDRHRADVRALGADVGGQTMTAFVLWVAEQSREAGVQHLAFLARDGELPLEIARALPADHWDDRTLRYLHCSRYTWSLAAASAIGVDRWLGLGTTDDDAFLHVKRHTVGIAALLARIGLTLGDLAGEPRYEELAVLEPDRVLPVGSVECWEALLADPAVHELIAERSDQRLKLIVDRLRAEGFPAGKFGLVDVGWRGRFASQVSAVLVQVVGEEPIHFHFGGDKVLPEVDATIDIRRFAFDGHSVPYPIETPVSCIETLTASGKPRVVDYRNGPDGEVEMVFDRVDGDHVSDRTELWTGAIEMARMVPSRADLDRWGLVPRSLAAETRHVLDLWWNHPSRTEAELLSGLTFEHDEAGTSLRPLVSPYRWSDLSQSGEPAQRQWPQGSAALSDRPMAALVRAVRATRRARRRLRDLVGG